MSNAVRYALQLRELLFDWWQDRNACPVTGSHGGGSWQPCAWTLAVIPYSDWPDCARMR